MGRGEKELEKRDLPKIVHVLMGSGEIHFIKDLLKMHFSDIPIMLYAILCFFLPESFLPFIDSVHERPSSL